MPVSQSSFLKGGLYRHMSGILLTKEDMTGDQVVNLREEILIHRVRYSLTSMDDKRREGFLDKAVKSIEK